MRACCVFACETIICYLTELQRKRYRRGRVFIAHPNQGRHLCSAQGLEVNHRLPGFDVEYLEGRETSVRLRSECVAQPCDLLHEVVAAFRRV